MFLCLQIVCGSQTSSSLCVSLLFNSICSMMFTRLIVLLLLIILWNVDGLRRVMLEIDVHPSNDAEDDVSGLSSDKDEIPCCNIGNYTSYSIVDVLNNVTTSNTIINISTDVVLSSIVTLEGLKNITIIGQGNPTVNCNDIGSVKFVSCNNITIQGVNWERCGSIKLPAYPGVKFCKSSNIFIKDSSFHHSRQHAVVLSNMLGNVYINNCQFTHNKYHKGHGTAIYYTTSSEQHTQVQLVINNCNFTFNGPAESVVYIDNSNNKVNGHISLLQNSTFIQNKGVPIYISHTSLLLNNSVSFKDNKATTGGGIYSRNSIIKFDDKCNVSFYSNSVSNKGGAIYQTHSKMFIRMNTVVMFVRNSAVRYGGAVFTEGRSLISFEDQSQVTFDDNRARSGGAICSVQNSSLLFCRNSVVEFNHNVAVEFGGGAMNFASYVLIYDNTSISFHNNTARWGGAISEFRNSNIAFDGNSRASFTENKVTGRGGALHCNFNSRFSFDGNSLLTFSDNSAVYGGGAIDSKSGGNCYTRFHGNSTLSFHNNIARYGGAILSDRTSKMSFTDNVTITFTNNRATLGGALEANNCDVSFDEHCTVTFSNNIATHHGGAIHSVQNSRIAFYGNSVVEFNHNKAVNHGGGAVDLRYTSYVLIYDNASVSFRNNTAIFGGAISDFGSSNISFDGNSRVTFTENKATDRGGAVHQNNNSRLSFSGNSVLTFSDNSAVYGGGAIDSFSGGKCYTTFHGNSTLSFHNNSARFGGAILSGRTSKMSFTDNVTITCTDNIATHGGVLHVNSYDVSFTGHAVVTFTNNTATAGGVLFASNCDVSFTGHSMVTFTNNTGMDRGGALYCTHNCHMSFNGNSTLTFNNNSAMNGGAMMSYVDSSISFDDSSTVMFNGNVATDRGGAVYGGGAIDPYFGGNCYTIFLGNSTVSFHNNKARYGGAIHSDLTSNVSFNHNVTITFINNTATSGGALNADNSNVSFSGYSLVNFRYNTAVLTGGALSCTKSSYLTFHGNSTVSFKSNKAVYSSGGAVASSSNSHMLLHGNTSITFDHNIARDGGAVSIVQSNLSISTHSISIFVNNTAKGHGGAIYLSDNFTAILSDGSDIGFSYNTATGYGGAIYGEISGAFQNKVILNTTLIHFYNNTALVGEDIFVHIPSSCDDLCIKNSIVGDTCFSQFGKHTIRTPRSKLVLGNPAVCIDEDNNTNCGKYYINNIMLGQEIIIDACVRDYYDQSADVTRFAVNSNDKDHHIFGSSNNVQISCDSLRGISVIGNKVMTTSNISVTLTSHDGSQPDLKTISVELITELSPCHPGFYYDNTTQSTSFIRRGYWFGVVSDRSTVTVCPNNYCNFACCEATKGFYELSPVRMNQCSSHRSGTACGSCEEGYTLSFDSVECVSVDKCTTGQTVMVVTLSMVYWIVIVILVFIMTYYHVGIGYLYAITYYYSMMDILLSQNLYQSNGLFTTVTTLSSLVKITPQFLGQLCLVTNMSGIDQQFIHYTHPLAVSVIIVIICQSARISYKFSSFISRGIIRTVCFLLLLSYTSVATTSLLLLRSLTFDNVDKVYTYLSPDIIEYCHGRHLPYFIVAVLCTLVIVIGLPLLLLLEPFLNHKISFTRMKPLLDQFQGCYKDKYRCFAAYYMICRLVIIVIIIAIPSNNNLSQFLLIFSSGVLALVVIVLKPYQHKILNIFDGLILQLVVLATLIPLADNVSQQLSTATIIIAMILPLISFIALELIVHKETIKTITTKIAAHFKTEPVSTTNDNNEVPMGDIGIIIDDNMRKNATICEIHSNTSDDFTHYRDSFLEVMDQIED
ncbi:outer membrane protein A-like isoform X2 [Dysidea avara]|uniref:outer membrane protein A-like isoform X2 n=1 Tax=Dysidea avara TaxID=196820 RepID=UPI003327B46B